LFAGSDRGGDRAATFYSPIGTGKLNGLNPEAYLRHVLEHIADHPIYHSHSGVAALELRRKRANRKRTRSVEEPTAGDSSTGDALSLPNIAELIEYGEITIGIARPVGCVAVANDEDNCLAMLARRDGETLAQLLARLDRAIGKALTEDIFTDEINPPST